MFTSFSRRRRLSGRARHIANWVPHVDNVVLRSLVGGISELVTLHAEDGSLLYLTPSARRFFGVADETVLLGLHVGSLVHQQDRPIIEFAFEQWLRGSIRSEPTAFRLLHSDGSWRALQATGSRHINDRGEVTVVVTSHDISDQDAVTLADIHARRRLDDAIEFGEIVVHFQPQVALESGHLVGFEALARWEHPELGLLPPCEFIPLAERTGQIIPIGRHVLEVACRQLLEIHATLPANASLPFVAVNVSARQLVDDSLVGEVVDALSSSGLDATYLWLEVTETALMLDVAACKDVLARLRTLGVHLAIDDFGTGWSSLAHLRTFPIEQLKIDRSFIAGLGIECDDTAVVTSVISLAHALGLQVVAEGIEDPTQLKLLLDLKCDVGQGYLWDCPRPHDEAVGRYSTGMIDAAAPATMDETQGELDLLVPPAVCNEHVVEFFDGDQFFAESLCIRLSIALRAGASVAVVAEQSHIAIVEKALANAGHDLAALRITGMWRAIDGQRALSRFVVDGVIDHVAFDSLASELIEDLSSSGKPVVVYSELVALRWAETDSTSAVELENWWSQLPGGRRFSLICGYPIEQFDDSSSTAVLHQICGLHSTVVPTEGQDVDSSVPHDLSIALLEQRARTAATERVSLEVELRRMRHELERLADLPSASRSFRLWRSSH